LLMLTKQQEFTVSKVGVHFSYAIIQTPIKALHTVTVTQF